MSLITLLSSTSFTPASLFASGEQGVWYDPSDLTTLFTDTAGTTRVTAAGQAVALMLDKSGRGNHAVQSVLAARPIYAVVPRTGRRNLLTYSEQFDNAVWTKTFSTVTANSVVAPDGTTTADTLSDNSASFGFISSGNISVTPSTTYTATIRVLKDSTPKTTRFAVLRLTFSGGTGFVADVAFDTSTGEVSLGNATSSQNGSVFSQDLGAYWLIRRTIQNTNNTLVTLNIFPAVGAGAGLTTYNATTEGSIVAWGAKLETGSTATAYQRVVSQYDVSEAGVEPLHYLSFDGIDDSMATSAINFTATDKMSVFAGVRKLSDAAIGTIAELGATGGTPGFFSLLSRNSPAYSWNMGGSAATSIAFTSGNFAAPITNVLGAAGDISGDIARIRANGVVEATETADRGTGNFSNAAIYIGRRGSTTLPFNGHLYGLVIRGAASSDAQIRNAEAWLNRKTGAY